MARHISFIFAHIVNGESSLGFAIKTYWLTCSLLNLAWWLILSCWHHRCGEMEYYNSFPTKGKWAQKVSDTSLNHRNNWGESQRLESHSTHTHTPESPSCELVKTACLSILIFNWPQCLCYFYKENKGDIFHSSIQACYVQVRWCPLSLSSQLFLP